MNVASGTTADRWQPTAASLPMMARQVAALFAVDPVGCGGVAIRSLATPARDAWLQLLHDLLPEDTPVRRVPVHINDERLLGGLDLAATLQAGRPIAQKGVLTLADGGVVLMAMAERMAAATAARLAAVIDSGEVALEREGLASRHPTRFGVVALDEGLADDERMAPALLDRLGFMIDLHPVLPDPAAAAESEGLELPFRTTRADVVRARTLLPRIEAELDVVQSLVAAALQLGVYSIRAPMQALRVARAAAALDGRICLIDEDVALAAALVLSPRATRMPTASPPPEDEQPEDQEPAEPPPPEQPEEPPEPEDPPPPPEQPDEDQADPPDEETEREPTMDDLAELVLAAAQAAIPPGLLAAMQLGLEQRARSNASGRVGAAKASQSRGRPRGARRGEPRAGSRLNVIETLRAAAPWQKLRQAEMARTAAVEVATARKRGATKQAAPVARVQVRRDDFHVTRYQQRSATTTVFVVDASGSSALNRLAEAKGAVELLLADCYVRRDQVAVLSFRGRGAELLLPPTRSLVRAKRSLAGLPGGGGTPLATGIDAAAALGEQIARRGETPIVVLLTDGRGNVARDGSPGRARAAEDVDLAARQYRLAGLSTLLIDTAPQPQPAAQALARTMGATYLPLPHAGSAALSRAVAQAGQAVAAAAVSR